MGLGPVVHGGGGVVTTGPGGTGSTPNTLQGGLVFDNGLTGAGVNLRLYNIGFGGNDTQLGQVISDSQGKYLLSYSLPSGTAPIPQALNLQVRALDPAGKEVTISATWFNAPAQATLNLVVPASVQPLAPEFQRLSADITRSIGGIAQLAQAQESPARQDLTFLTQATNWDSRLVALAAMAAQQAAATGLGQDALYALFRVGLPSDPGLLATVPAATVQQALATATKAGIVSFTDQQISAAVSAFQGFAMKTLMAMKAPGTISPFSSLLSRHVPPDKATAFANLYFSNAYNGSGLWAEAAKLGIDAATLAAVRLQGKCLYLTKNNDALAEKVQQDIGSTANLSKLPGLDYHTPNKWKSVLTTLAEPGGDTALAALIPERYQGATTADRLALYAEDMARPVRIAFPNEVTARKIESTQPAAANFLRSASAQGYKLGRTPLNPLLATSGLDDATKAQIKVLHRLYQVTRSDKSFEAALNLKFTSASHIASYSKADFMTKFGAAFPPGEAELVYGQAQMVSSVTFNAVTMAKALDTSAPVYALSSSEADRQNAKTALVKQFLSMSSLFGNLDFCDCQECRSVLSPAAYFVDLLDMLGQNSKVNAKGNTPLDVLIGKDSGIKGRRPDLGALPLTCANTNTAMPYIDLVNEIFEYYIAHNNSLDGGIAYDTGSATTADLTAEPQHIIPDVYTNTLSKAVYPLNLPFDLWTETVRGFLGHFKISLAQLLDTFRPVGNLELFTSAPPTAYFRSQILAEALGISPAEYAVFTATDTTKWFTLYGYTNQGDALNNLKSAKTLSQRLGVSYQELTDLMKTGFVNPGLYPLIFQFERFGIDMGTAFSFTNQPGYPKWTDLSAQDPQKAGDFQALMNRMSAQYPGFDPTVWLNKILPPNYSSTVLVLADPNTGCDFSSTMVQYADGTTDAKPLDFLKLNLFVRLWKKLGWTMDETDRALQAFFLSSLPAFTDAGFTKAFGDAWKTAFVYLAHLDDLNTRLAPPLGRAALLPLWADLPTQGENPLYAQLFLTPSVLNDDSAFDDPNGGFPGAGANPFSAHAVTVQGILGLKAAEVDASLSDAGVTAPAAFSLANISVCYRYSLFTQCLQLSHSDMMSLKAMSGLNPFQKLAGSPLKVLADDILLNQTLAFVKLVAAVQNSGFTVEDLKYLLRHQFDPVGKYRDDPNALITLMQTIASGLRQIQTQSALPDLAKTSESVIDQSLSKLFPAAVLRTLFAQLTNAQIYTASASASSAIVIPDMSEAPELTLAYDSVTNAQTLTCKGLLLDWRKAEIEALNTDSGANTVFGTLLADVQKQAQADLGKSVADVLGVWAQDKTLPGYNDFVGSLLAMSCNVQTYKATESGVVNQIDVSKFVTELAEAQAQPNPKITDPVPAVQITYDAATEMQTLTCTGVVTAQVAGYSWTDSILKGMLTTVRSQAVAEFQFLGTGLLAPGINDPDPFVGQFLGLDLATQQKFARAALVTAFLPLLVQKLSRQLVVQTLSSNLSSDPVLTDALVADPTLLSDPIKPGKSLLQTFLDVSRPGVSATYYSSSDLSGTPQAAGRADTVDTADATNSAPPGTGSCRFEGYLQAPTDGPFRFFAELGNSGAKASFALDSPDPNALFTNPVIQATAAKDGDEASQFVQLKGGVAYHFTLDFHNLGANGAKMLVQGEGLSKGPLTQLILFPQQTVDAFVRAKVLLAKATQILQATGLNVREASYLTANAANFNNFSLSALPPQASDDSLSKAVSLFSQFLTLADYADLRKSPAGGTDGLIGVFQAASQSSVAAAGVLANLTRREPQVVQDTAAALGPDPHFSNNVGIRLVWDALQLVHILGLPPKAIGDSTAIVNAGPQSSAIAANFKNAVKAQYTPDQWRPIAQSVFDSLRKKKRDALVWYLVRELGLENSNRLFEYFLVDPGMEPVVQTSRLRLALSSVQTFIQRCFLNLENNKLDQNGKPDPASNVSADAIPADWWAWMKRYRVWQANREIFLFPENWMEPELRTDRTDLFQALASALLQGDVTRDLVEDAFSGYLKGLDLRARLQIVASYLDQDTANPGNNILYVLGRTYSLPHKYFFRTYAYSTATWSNWKALTFDIEGDHTVLVVWRGRLNLFWVTFLLKPAPSQSTAGATYRTLADMAISDTDPSKQVLVQLHWSEYVQGKWTNRLSTDSTKAEPIDTPVDFDPNNARAHVHVSKELDSNGNEGAVRIHVDLPHVESQEDRDNVGVLDPRTFRVTGKNCDPDFSFNYWENPPFVPYVPWSVVYSSPTEYPGSGTLTATFQSAITSSSSGTPETEPILDRVSSFELLTCANAVVPPSLPPTDPDYDEVGGLVSPFFFMDTSNPDAPGQTEFQGERTYFVQPTLTETVILEWDGWAIPPALPAENWADPSVLNHIAVVAQAPTAGPAPIAQPDPVYSLFAVQDRTDWATHPSVAISYGGVAIGRNGGIRTVTLPAVSTAGRPTAVAGTGLVMVGGGGVRVSQIPVVRAAKPIAAVPSVLVRS